MNIMVISLKEEFYSHADALVGITTDTTKMQETGALISKVTRPFGHDFLHLSQYRRNHVNHLASNHCLITSFQVLTLDLTPYEKHF